MNEFCSWISKENNKVRIVKLNQVYLFVEASTIYLIKNEKHFEIRMNYV